MKTRLYYLMSFLPPLPPLGEPPPISAGEVLLKIFEQESAKDLKLVAEVFDFEAQLFRAAYVRLLGHTSVGDTVGAFSIDSQAPPFLVDVFLKDPQEIGEDAWFTELLEQHLNFMEGVGKNIDSPLLIRWTRWERSLRRQLSEARRRSESETHVKASVEGEWNHGALIAEWSAASDPLAGERLLDKARMEFIDQESMRYSFTIDELVAYLLKLGLLARHAQMQREEGVKILEEVTTL